MRKPKMPLSESEVKGATVYPAGHNYILSQLLNYNSIHLRFDLLNRGGVNIG